eukprot:7680280-Heterocapsa_arctica.AAC.1
MSHSMADLMDWAPIMRSTTIRKWGRPIVRRSCSVRDDVHSERDCRRRYTTSTLKRGTARLPSARASASSRRELPLMQP